MRTLAERDEDQWLVESEVIKRRGLAMFLTTSVLFVIECKLTISISIYKI